MKKATPKEVVPIISIVTNMFNDGRDGRQNVHT